MSNCNVQVSEREDINMTSFEDLGPNSGLVEEMYRRYLDDPQSVAEAWRDFFADYQPRWSAPNGNGGAPAAAAPAAPAAPPAPPAPAPHSVGIRTEPAAPDPRLRHSLASLVDHVRGTGDQAN